MTRARSPLGILALAALLAAIVIALTLAFAPGAGAADGGAVTFSAPASNPITLDQAIVQAVPLGYAMNPSTCGEWQAITGGHGPVLTQIFVNVSPPAIVTYQGGWWCVQETPTAIRIGTGPIPVIPSQ